MKIIVTYSSNVVGNGTFWEGTADEISTIRNVVGQKLAAKVIADNQAHSLGMWTAQPYEMYKVSEAGKDLSA